MSLLMDALKKAELAKRQAQEGAAADTQAPAAKADLALAPREPVEQAAPTALPELPQKLEILDAEFIAEAKRPRTPKSAGAPAPASPPGPPDPTADKGAPATEPAAAPAVDADSARRTARQVFDAKQAAPASRQPFLIAVGALTLVAAAGIGVYFWLQLQPPSPSAVPRGPAIAAPPLPSPVAPAAPSPPLPSPAAEAIARAPERPAPPSPEPPPSAEPRPAARATAPDPSAPIRITASRARINPALVRAFEALDGGNLDAAEAEYAAVLKSEPKNPDALQGMAAVALRQGRHEIAEEHYLRAIEADPKNAVAQAGLVGLRGQVDPTAAESRIKNLIAAQPDQPFLQFALGNLHAAAGRWNEAQQAFFKAHTGDPAHPDYLFNLAVSLDHLRQPRLAAQFYQQALAAAGTRPAGFDKAQAEARLRELQP